MNDRGNRHFARGGAGGMDPPRRRFRGQYIRRRTPSGGGGYVGGSFSDDRNDSSPPTNSTNARPMLPEETSYNVDQPHYHSHRNQRQPRGMRHHEQRESRYPNDRTSSAHDDYNSRQMLPNRNFANIDNEYYDQEQSQQHHRENTGLSGSSNKKLDELTKTLEDQRTDIVEIRLMFQKLNTELEQAKGRIKELESSGVKVPQQQSHGNNPPSVPVTPREASDWDAEKDKRKKAKLLKQRERSKAKLAMKRGTNSEAAFQQKILNPEQSTTAGSDKQQPQDSGTVNDQAADHQNTEQQQHHQHQQQQQQQVSTTKFNRRTNRERNSEKPRRVRSEKTSKALPRLTRSNINDDSTTQAAEPSSEDRPEGDDGRDGTGKERVKVLRRKKQHLGRRGTYGNRRHRADSSERNSNDTSPQNEANGTEDYPDKKKKNNKKTYPKLSESELNDIVQTLKREFVNSERSLKEIKSTMNAKGPKVVYEFAVSILDHAICDVTSPTKLSEISNSLFQLIVSDDNINEVDFQQGFYDALSDISKREDDIAIDAPRYMDTLGQVLADCIVLMSNKHKYLVRKFLTKCVESYCKQNMGLLLVSILKNILGVRKDRFAQDLGDIAKSIWDNVIKDGSDFNQILESHDIKIPAETNPVESQKSKKDSKELEKFADDITSMVEQHCTSQKLDEFVMDLNYNNEERVDYLGTFIYAIVRGCLTTDSGVYKLDTDALNKYSDILSAKHEDQKAIALNALTALTKLWHQYTYPQDLLCTILQALYTHETAPYEALKDWLNSDSLTNIPGIGAARLNSKRYIEDLGANLKS